MKQAKREDIQTLESKFFISSQSTFFELQYFSEIVIKERNFDCFVTVTL